MTRRRGRRYVWSGGAPASAPRSLSVPDAVNSQLPAPNSQPGGSHDRVEVERPSWFLRISARGLETPGLGIGNWELTIRLWQVTDRPFHQSVEWLWPTG